MIRFPFLEQLGVTAAMSDRMDHDCSHLGRADIRAQFLDACGGAVGRLVCVKQIHGAEILQVDRSHAGQGALNISRAPGEADGLLTKEPGLPLGVTIADCAPVFLYARDVKAGGVLHAGREGTRQNISGKGVEQLRQTFGASPGELYAVIGPSAGPCCYEVSTEMADAWEAAGLPRSGRMLDLWEANRQQLLAAGLTPDHIEVAGHCTICSERFFSHRRAPGTGHNLAVFML